MTNPKCLGRAFPDTFSAKSADSTGLKMRRITRAASFDHLIGEREQAGGNVDAKRLRSAQIDHQVELDRLLHWDVGRLLPFQDTGDIDASEAILVGNIDAVAR